MKLFGSANDSWMIIAPIPLALGLTLLGLLITKPNQANHRAGLCLHTEDEIRMSERPMPVMISSMIIVIITLTLFQKPNHPQSMELPDRYIYDVEPTLLLQPVTKSISQEQLRVELRSIYSGLVMVENKCKNVDREQTRLAVEGNPNCRPALLPKQWQALIALHKTLLHEFHDFFLASQHPAATPNLTKLAARNSMPARLWQFGIHNFLEVLRFRLPESLDYMLAFIYTAYSMMTLLYETVPVFADTWIECLGDLGRYRVAVEDDDRRDRETWSGVSRYWYKKAWDKKPEIGRLAHHLAILSPPFTFDQVSLYLRALASTSPFESAKTSIINIMTPALERKQDSSPTSSHIDILFIKLVSIMFRRQQLGSITQVLEEWKLELIRDIHKTGSIFQSCALVRVYGSSNSVVSLYSIARPRENRSDISLTECIVNKSEFTIMKNQSSSPLGFPLLTAQSREFERLTQWETDADFEFGVDSFQTASLPLNSQSEATSLGDSNAKSVRGTEVTPPMHTTVTGPAADNSLKWMPSAVYMGALLVFQHGILRLLRGWKPIAPWTFTFSAFVPIASAAPITGSQPDTHSTYNSFTITDYVTIAIGVALMVGSRLLPSCLHVDKTDLSLYLSACEAFTWWAAKSDDRSSPIFLIVYVRYDRGHLIHILRSPCLSKREVYANKLSAFAPFTSTHPTPMARVNFISLL